MMKMQDQITPKHAKKDSIPVAEGDIIIAGTNGLFNNLFDEDIIEIAEEALRDAFDINKEFASDLSERIVRRAISLSMDSVRKSPFSLRANKMGT
jgi:protein phosphatase PTC7